MILHIDMDAFYASVELLDNPELAGKCVIVGGSSNRGVVSAASYEARKFGVHSAMPIFQAKQRCPDAVFIHPRMGRYKEISITIMSILKKYTPLVEQVSIDEAFMDITGCDRLFGSPQQIGTRIKQDIAGRVHLTCSVGIAPNRFMAKIASDMQKPDGLTIIMPGDVDEFIRTLPIRSVPGVGKKTLQQLEKIRIQTLGDIRHYPEKMLMDRLGKYGRRLIELADGIDPTPVKPGSRHKSVSTERTLAEDISDREVLKHYLLKHSDEVARQLRKLDVRAKTITLKIKHSDFQQITRSSTLAYPTRSSDIIYYEASHLLDRYRFSKKVRLIGVGASGLSQTSPPVQLTLFDKNNLSNENWDKVDRAVDRIASKFGKHVIQRATLKNDK